MLSAKFFVLSTGYEKYELIGRNLHPGIWGEKYILAQLPSLTLFPCVTDTHSQHFLWRGAEPENGTRRGDPKSESVYFHSTLSDEIQRNVSIKMVSPEIFVVKNDENLGLH